MWKRFLTTDAKQWATIPLRIALGVIFLSHGGQKLFGWLGGKGLEGTAGFFAGKLGLNPGILWALLAGIAEFGGGLLVVLGYDPTVISGPKTSHIQTISTPFNLMGPLPFPQVTWHSPVTDI